MNQENKIRIGIITQYFHPDIGATADLLTDLAIGLSEKGCDVRVYTGYPCYWNTKERASKRENYHGVTISRVFNTQLDTRKKIGEACNGLTFFISVIWNLLLSREDRIFLIVTSPPFLPYAGYLLNILKQRQYVIILYDLEPDLCIKVGYLKDGLLTRLWRMTYSRVYERSSGIVVLGQCMAESIRERIQENSHSKISIIQNWADEKFIVPREKEGNWFSEKYNLKGTFTVLYSGNMSIHHDLETVLQAAEFLKNEDVTFLLIGDGIKKEQLVQQVKEANLPNVVFLPFQPHEIIPYSLTCGDVIIVSQEEGTEGLCVSCKLYTSMAAGKPLLAVIGENSEIARVVNEYHCGIVVRNGDAEGFADAIQKLRTDKELCKVMGGNARKAFEENFTREHAIDKYNQVIRDFAYVDKNKKIRFE